jgi:hypothetical protein
MLDFEPNASRFFALEPRRLMHILGYRTPIFASEGGGQEFESFRRRVAAERTLTLVTEENLISMSQTDFVTGRRHEQTRKL